MQSRLIDAGRTLALAASLAALAACGGGGGGSGTPAVGAAADGATAGSTGATTAPGTNAGSTGTTTAPGTNTGSTGTAATGATPGGSGGAATAAGAPILSSGVMTKGSVIINGVRYDDSAATVRIDDRAGTVAELANGMVIRMRGRLNDDGVTGRAELVEVHNEVRGLVQSVNLAASPPVIVVGGLNVAIDDSTVLANLPALSALAAGTSYVEVHGPRDELDVVRASRVEVQNRNAPGLSDELRGTVSGAAPGAFSLGAVRVTYSASTAFTPANTTAAALANGAQVEVHGAFTGPNTFTASRVHFEDRADDSLRGSNGERSKVEGYATGLNTAASLFVLQGRTVQYTAATRFRNGTLADLASGQRVEVDGTLSGNTIVAREISFKQTQVRLEGLATQVNAAGRTLTVLGQTVRVDDRTSIDARTSGGGGGSNSARTSLTGITAGVDCVEVRGRQVGTTLLADEVKESSSCGPSRVRGPVTAENEANFSLTVLDALNATLANTSVFRSLSGASLTRAQFFAAVVPANRTAVQLRGTFAGGVLQVTEAELED